MYRPYGIIPPIITPFNADGSVNYESLAQMSKFLLDSGVHRGLGLVGQLLHLLAHLVS